MPDTIAAIATASAAAAVGIVRLSGAETRCVLAALFTPVDGRSAAELPPRRMTYGTVRDVEGRTLDHALAVVFSAGHSYTGEESAELHCHGSPVVLQEVLRAAFAAGARQARAGEFTERAFLNGKMDLTEAEAVIDLIDAETAEAARNAAAQVDGALRRPLEQVYDALLGLTSRFYAVVDYPDEDIGPLEAEQIGGVLSAAAGELRTRPAYALTPAGLDYEAMTVPVEKATLLTNPTGIFAKEPTLWWQLQQLMEGARDRVYLQTPYAVPSAAMYDGLARVAEKGIPFEMQLNSVAVGDNLVASSDYLTNRSRLLDTGVTVWEWFGDYSSHGKAALIDDLAVVGSYNFDMRSTYLDTEMMLVFYGDAFYDLLEANLMEMEAQCLQVSEEGYLPRAGVEPKTYGPPKSILYPVTRWLSQPFRFLI